MAAWEIAIGVVGGFMLFFNGYITATVEAREEEFFFQKWEEEVKESQDIKIGKMGMKIYYFIPTIASAISLCKYKFTKYLEKKSL